MKTLLLNLLFLSFIFSVSAQNGNVGIGTNTPDTSAMLDVNSANKGLLTPHLDLDTTVFPGSGPAKGLMVWNTNNSFKSGEGFYYNEGTKTAPIWVRFGKYSNSNLTDVGVVIAFPGANYPNDMYLPLSGGVYNKIDYPDFVEMIASLDANVVTADATTFTLADWNSNGEFLRGQGTNAAAVGSLQTDATARPATAFTTATTTINGGSHSHNHSRITSFETAGWSSAYSFGSKTVPTSGWSGSRMTGEGGAAGAESGLRFKSEVLNTSPSSHSHNLPALNVTGGGDTETRPVNRSVTWLIKVKPSSAIVDTLIVNSVSNTSNITDVNTAPHAQQTSIAKGAALRCFDGVNWEADVVEGFADAGVNFSTPWGIQLQMNSTEQQFYIKNVSGNTKQGHLEYSYSRIVDGVSSDPEARNFTSFTHGSFISIWHDATLIFHNLGDIEMATIKWANSDNDMAAGNYQEFEITCVAGSLYNNNYYRIKRLK